MDTGTHVVFGLGLAGLAMTDPAIASHPHGAVAILLATVAGSNAPDLDMLLRLRGNADYIKHHRGISHSLPAVVIWTVLITLAVSLMFPQISWWHLGIWVLVAVIVHVVSDLFNAYGTQAYRPISRQWVKWNIIHIFDPFIFLSHVVAIILWAAEIAHPRVIFPALYLLLVIYYIWRTWIHRTLTRRIPQLDPARRAGDCYTVLPTMFPYKWHIVRQSEDGLYGVGEWERGAVNWHDTLTCDDHPAVKASESHRDVKAFLDVTPFPCADLRRHSWGYEVRWLDIRYRYRKQYPFVAVVLMDLSLVPLQSYVGWLSDERLERRLHISTY